MREERTHVRGASAREAQKREDHEDREQAERHHVLKETARVDPAVIHDGDEQGEAETDGEARRVDRAAADRVELKRIERRKDAREEIARGDRFPRTHDGV